MLKAIKLNIKSSKYATSILLGVALFVNSSCENDLKEIALYNNNEILPEIEIYDFELLFTKNGRNQYSLISPLAKKYNNKEQEIQFPKGCKLITFNEIGEIKSTFKADSATYFQGKELKAFKKVDIINQEGDKLKSKSLTWVEEEKTFNTKDSVFITQNGETISGVGMEAKDDFSYYKILKLTGKIQINETK